MIVHVDTSTLIDALAGPRRSLPRLIAFADEGHRLAVCSIVLYEWLRGPRTDADLAAQEAALPSEHAVPFGPEEARLAARLYRAVRRPRGREVDLAVAACAIAAGAALWSRNPADFRDIPSLRLV